MILNELYDRSPSAYQDIGQDNSQTTMDSLRKTRLTLRQINKLRLQSESHQLEQKSELEFIRQMYGTPVGEEAAPAQ